MDTKCRCTETSQVPTLNFFKKRDFCQRKSSFVFRGIGKRPPQLTPPSGIKYQWAPKGSYCLGQLLEMISHLPNPLNMLTHQNYAIYVLDDNFVHLIPKVQQLLWKRDYILVIIGGGITVFV